MGLYDHCLLALLLFLCINLSSSSFSQGKEPRYVTADAEEVSGMSFEYIVVGGGTTGCPLAATLSEKFSVLLVERGGSPYGNPLITDRESYGFSLLQTDEYSSVAQGFVSEDGVGNLRGRVLGGSSAINGGFYSRASEDFVKQAGWEEKLVQDSYKWVESRVVSTPELTPWQTVVEFGFLEAGVLPYNGFSLEHIPGTKIGGSIFDQFGKRHSSANLLEAGNPSNITVLLNATVKSLIFHDRSDGNESRVCGIKYMKSDGSTDQIYEAYINQPENTSSWGDVILSAGALGSPQILLLSGIGPRKHIEKFNISTMVDLKVVGKEMKDNPSIALLVDPSPESPQIRQPEPPLVAAIASNFKFIIEAGVIPISFNSTRMPIAAKIAFPESKGTLKLQSTDPRKNPLVKFNYLTKKEDLDECVNMVSVLEHVARSESVSFFLGNQPQHKYLTRSEDELKQFCRDNVRTYYHFHGGCVVGRVIDQDYRVLGVEGLRVIDGSTLIESPGTNPMATLMMLGRYQGIKILRQRKRVSAFVTHRSP
ncbi:(R)-mandelonitrile lyase-like isoform X2 [Carica papaya]|uniref:(R)-mandelonitrile lyase-like isoform X2 n=1 Tax=Carica papaya TaxID=3649 RepID=UPI000B8CCCA3|nr:(R)-mandelonitrile lyase-like isoform X2 [Carica papaya]